MRLLHKSGIAGTKCVLLAERFQKNMDEVNPVPTEETYKIVRGRIEHVANLLGQRVIWMVIAQSFFFSAYAILLTGKPSDPQLVSLHEALKLLIPVAGLLTVALTFVDVIAAVVQMKKLRRSFEIGDGMARANDLHYPPLNANHTRRIFMHASPISIPILFILVWVVLLVARAHA